MAFPIAGSQPHVPNFYINASSVYLQKTSPSKPPLHKMDTVPSSSPPLDMEPSTGSRDFLSHMPLDIMFIINKHLPQFSRVCLALSSRSLCTALYPSSELPSITAPEKMALLQPLERKIPGRFFCFFCKKLCFFEQSVGWRGQKHHECPLTIVPVKELRPYVLGGENYYEMYDGKITGNMFEIAKLMALSRWEPPQSHAWAKSRHLFTDRVELCFGEAYLAMNRHLYGPGYGIQLERSSTHEAYISRRFKVRWASRRSRRGGPYTGPQDLPNASSRKVHFTRGMRKRTGYQSANEAELWKFHRRLQAKVIHDNLYLHVLHSISAPRVSAEQFKYILRDCGLPICRHLQLASSKNYTADIPGLQEAYNHAASKRKQPVFQFHDFEDEARSCTCCFTDFAVSLQTGDDSRGWKLELSTYHFLGKCRTPRDVEWKAFVSVISRGDLHQVRHLRDTEPNLNLGMIRKQWDESCGVPVDGDGEAKWACPRQNQYSNFSVLYRGGWSGF